MLRWLVCIPSVFVVIYPFCAYAKSADLLYDVYAGGIHGLQANVQINLSKSSYNINVQAKTRGVLGALAPWSGAFKTKGVQKGGQIFPKHHDSVSTWKGTDDATKYVYDENGHFFSVKRIEGTKDRTPKDIDVALTRNTTDILTATLRTMLDIKNKKTCTGQSDIFDSRRRFSLRFSNMGMEDLSETRYSFFKGKAMKCLVEVIPKGGAWKKKPRGWLSIQEQGRKKGALPALWFAEIDPDFPAVPVRIMVKTDYGTLFMHLTSAHVRVKDIGGR